MLVYPSGVDVSSSALRFLTQQLRRHRHEIGSRWRRLSAGRQALLTLAHLKVGHTYAQLAAGFGVGTTTAYRYVTEAVELLATLAPSLADAVRTASVKAFLILDGTLLPIDRIAADRPFYSGKHKKHGMNVQVLADPFGRLLWAPPALPGAVHDVRAAREHGIVDVNPLELWRSSKRPAPRWSWETWAARRRGTIAAPGPGRRAWAPSADAARRCGRPCRSGRGACRTGRG